MWWCFSIASHEDNFNFNSKAMLVEIATLVQKSTALKIKLQDTHRAELVAKMKEVLVLLTPHSQGSPDEAGGWLHNETADITWDRVCELYKEKLKKVKGNDIRCHVGMGSTSIKEWEDFVGFWQLTGAEANNESRDELVVHIALQGSRSSQQRCCETCRSFARPATSVRWS